jgi:plastocyanin
MSAERRLVVLPMVLLLLLTACGMPATPTPAPTSVPHPSITITSPAPGVTLVEGPVAVTIQVTDFAIVSKLGQPGVVGEGHLHYYLDAEPPTTPGQPAVTAPGTYAATADMSHSWQGVAPGSHTLAVQLVNNDHTPLVPPVIAEIVVQVASAPMMPPPPSMSPSMRITSPAQGVTLPVGTVTVTVEVADFSLASKLGEPNVAGEGHIHYYLDAEPPTTPGQPALSAPGTYAAAPGASYYWHDVQPGSHTLGVQLVNNDHTPLEPPVVAEVNVDVSILEGTAVTILLNAEDGAFDTDSITVPLGAAVTVVLNNMDADRHNVAVYEDAAATRPVFVGDAIMGPRTVVYQFTAPSAAGPYYFRCDTHPLTMTGELLVSCCEH